MNTWIPVNLDQKQKFVYSIIEFLSSENNEELEVAIDILKQQYKVKYEETNFSNKKTLFQVFKKEMIEEEKTSEVEKMNMKSTLKYDFPTKEANVLLQTVDERLDSFLEILKKKKYFQNFEEGSGEYEHLNNKAKETFFKKEKDAEEESNKLKLQGNKLVGENKLYEAIDCYIKAIEIFPRSSILFGNLASVYNTLEDYENAKKCCLRSIEIDPTYSKGYSRFGSVYYNQRQYENALKQYNKALELEPNSQIFKSNIAKINEKIESEKEEQEYKQKSIFPTEKFSSSMMEKGGSGQMPSFDNIQQMPSFDNIQQMMQNPELLKTAQHIMQQPGFQEMMGQFMSNYMTGESESPFGNLDELKPTEEEIREIEEDEDYKKSEKLQKIFKRVKEEGSLKPLAPHLMDEEVQQLLQKIAARKMGSFN